MVNQDITLKSLVSVKRALFDQLNRRVQTRLLIADSSKKGEATYELIIRENEPSKLLYRITHNFSIFGSLLLHKR
jgi:hypothetical protein